MILCLQERYNLRIRVKNIFFPKHFQNLGLLQIVSRNVFEDSAISSDPQLIGVAQHLIDCTTVPLCV